MTTFWSWRVSAMHDAFRLLREERELQADEREREGERERERECEERGDAAPTTAAARCAQYLGRRRWKEAVVAEAAAAPVVPSVRRSAVRRLLRLQRRRFKIAAEIAVITAAATATAAAVAITAAAMITAAVIATVAVAVFTVATAVSASPQYSQACA